MADQVSGPISSQIPSQMAEGYAAFLKIFGVSITVLGLAALVWLGLRLYGQAKTPTLAKKSVFFTRQFDIIAHRGGSLEVPENTILAFEHALTLDPQIVFEMDVRLTADDQLVVIHDDTLERTSNGFGTVREKTLSDLLLLDAGYSFTDEKGEHPYRGKGVKIPTLEEVLIKFPTTRIVLDLKDNLIKAGDKVADLLEKRGVQNRVVIASEHGSILHNMHKFFPDWLYGASQDIVLKSVTLASIGLTGLDSMKADLYSIPEMHNNIRVLTPTLLTELKRRQKKTYIWTVNDEADFKRLIAMGVDGIITDRPSALLKLLAQDYK